MRVLPVLLFLLSVLNGLSQKVIDVGNNALPNTNSLFYTVGGQPVSNAKYVRVVDGTAYLNETFKTGKIMLSKGAMYQDIMLKLDLMDNTLHYLTATGEELTTTTPVKSIWLEDPLTKKEARFDNAEFLQTTGKIEPGWYQQLDSGKVILYKRTVKTIRENKPYGSATVEQYINNVYSYYLYTNGVFTNIKKIKFLPDMLQDKKPELLQYISSNNFSGRSDADYISVIAYYNSLVKK